MNDTNPVSTGQWVHYYQQTAAAPTNPPLTTAGNRGGFSDTTTTTSTIVTTSFTTNNSSSPNNSTSIVTNAENNNLVNAKVGTVAKPIRRRSRASRRTPTTLLNASTTNFRALVQQFTGCHNTTVSGSFGNKRGPLNLSFGTSSDNYQSNPHGNQLGTSSSIGTFGCDYNYTHQPLANNQTTSSSSQWRQQQNQEMYSKEGNNMEDGGGNLDDFVIDDVSDLHELMDESSPFSGNGW